jgi:2-oxoglutarate ferredoxin oxidoreductase subunit gamma
MLERLLVAGSGGQGANLLGKFIARLGLDVAPHVSFVPAYGAEVRGGTSHGTIILSTAPIASPLAEELDSVIVMNQGSADSFLPMLHPQGLAFVNASLCRTAADTRHICLPATRIAEEAGSAKAANFVLLGAYVARKRILTPEAVEAGIVQQFGAGKADAAAINIRAFRAGLEKASR